MMVASVSCFSSWMAMEPTPCGAADDQNRIGGAGHGAGHFQPVEQHLIRGQRGERQRRGIGGVRRGAARDAVIHQVVFGIGAGAVDGAGCTRCGRRV